MTKWGLVIDVNKCNACYNCFVACKDEFWGNDWPPYSKAQPKFGHQWLRLEKRERGQFPFITLAYMPVMCMHCDDAPCIDSCPLGAIYKRDDGIVLIDPEKCDSTKCNGECADACPYGAIYFNDELKIAQKCTMCAHLLDEGKGRKPRCVEACPTGAMIFGDLDDPESDVSRILRSNGEPTYLDSTKVIYEGRAEVYEPRPGIEIKPNVRYIGLHRITKQFIAGSVAFKDTDDLVEGAKAVLISDGREIGRAETDAFGQLMFDGLDPGRYVVRVEYPGYRQLEVEVELKESRYLGYLFLERE